MGLTLEKQFNKMFSTKRKYDSTTKEVGEEIPTKNISNYGVLCITNLRLLYTVFILHILEDATYVKYTSDATHVCDTGLQ